MSNERGKPLTKFRFAIIFILIKQTNATDKTIGNLVNHHAYIIVEIIQQTI